MSTTVALFGIPSRRFHSSLETPKRRVGKLPMHPSLAPKPTLGAFFLPPRRLEQRSFLLLLLLLLLSLLQYYCYFRGAKEGVTSG